MSVHVRQGPFTVRYSQTAIVAICWQQTATLPPTPPRQTGDDRKLTHQTTDQKSSI